MSRLNLTYQYALTFEGICRSLVVEEDKRERLIRSARNLIHCLARAQESEFAEEIERCLVAAMVCVNDCALLLLDAGVDSTETRSLLRSMELRLLAERPGLGRAGAEQVVA